MEVYSDFSKVYDMFMENIPYQKWSKRIIQILNGYGIYDGIVTDLGCGTGCLTQLLAEAGYDMIGIDYSMDMLEQAMEKRCESGYDSILYLNQDMREFELYGTVRAIVCTCDSLNYLLEEDEVLQVFKLVNNYLDPDGIFIFDITTKHKYLDIDNCVIAENQEDASFIWENTYFEEEKINEYELTLFIKDNEDGKYVKSVEIHQQRAYEIEELVNLLDKAGLKTLKIEDAYTGKPYREMSERILITASKKESEV